MKKIILLGISAIFSQFLLSQTEGLMLPAPQEREQLIHHNGFSMSYSSAYVFSSWVAYNVTQSEVDKAAKVNPKYVPDPAIQTRSAEKKDYKDSGYEFAQLCNYLGVMHLEGATAQSFYMSNIVPMKLAFYTHMWLKTEDLIRMWLGDKQVFHIVAGPIAKDAPFTTLGENKVAVPKNYYKVVYDPQNQQSIAFKFKNGVSSGSLKSYTLSVDKLEEETGIDFFPELEDELENKIESTVNYAFWNFELEKELK